MVCLMVDYKNAACSSDKVTPILTVAVAWVKSTSAVAVGGEREAWHNGNSCGEKGRKQSIIM